MKCQKCEKTATFHITDLTGEKLFVHHLCEEHAREYLSDSSEQGDPVGSLAATLAEGIPAKSSSLGKKTTELQDLDRQTCPICDISFYDFRNRGRLGCPNDYDCFHEQLDVLIMNIHGEQEHVGKEPKRSGKGTTRRTLLIKLRRDLEDAVRYEDYERATELRDQIKEIEAE